MSTTLLYALQNSLLDVTSVNGAASTGVEVSFKKNTMRVTTHKGSHYFKDLDQLIVHNNKVDYKDLSGQSVLLELGIFKQPNFDVPNGHYGCHPSALVKVVQCV